MHAQSLTVPREKSNVAALLAGPFEDSVTGLPPATTAPPGVAATRRPANDARSEAAKGAAGMRADVRAKVALVRTTSRAPAREPA